MPVDGVVYCYPIWHTVSFSLIAKRHIEQLRRRGAYVYEWDELSVPRFSAIYRYSLAVHPMFYCVHRWSRMLAGEGGDLSGGLETLKSALGYYERVVGFDVADSDAVSPLAVQLAEAVSDVVVPSTWARDVYVGSGVRVPVHVVPHGVPSEWLSSPSPGVEVSGSSAFRSVIQFLGLLKEMGVKVLLFFLWHSPERKGWPEVLEFYKRLRGERDDVVLLVKSLGPLDVDPRVASKMGIVNVFGWLSEAEKMLLYDVADLTLLFTRGGGFELNGLESLARGTPVIAHRRGSWVDYMPDWLLVKEGRRMRVFEGNMVHVGYGYTVDIESALDLAHRILDSPGEWRCRVREYAVQRLAREFTWDAVGERVAELLLA
ncbi:MAG: hypothetical protein QXZ31_05475 [Thermofilaceae archaeon]